MQICVFAFLVHTYGSQSLGWLTSGDQSFVALDNEPDRHSSDYRRPWWVQAAHYLQTLSSTAAAAEPLHCTNYETIQRGTSWLVYIS